MTTEASPSLIYLVDDEPALCRAVCNILENNEFQVSVFQSAEECLPALADTCPDLVMIDHRLPGKSGLWLLQTIRQSWPGVPVIMLTGFGSVELAVHAMKAGAADFIEKPFDKQSLLHTVRSAVQTSRIAESASHRLFGKPLSESEKRVLHLLLLGKTNREIADTLHRSVRTVEDHRSHLMAKLGARNIVELIKFSGHLELEI